MALFIGRCKPIYFQPPLPGGALFISLKNRNSAFKVDVGGDILTDDGGALLSGGHEGDAKGLTDIDQRIIAEIIGLAQAFEGNIKS